MDRPGHNPARLAGQVLALVALAFLGWRVLTLGIADWYATDEPARALGWRPAHPEALLAHSQALAADAQSARAAELARRALRADPLDGRPYRVLGGLAEADGDAGLAARLYGIAAERSPRDVSSHVWLSRHFLALGDVPGALSHMDMVLRVAPEEASRLLPVFLALAASPVAHEPLATTLAGGPRWRRAVLVQVIRQTPDMDALAGLMDRLRKANGGLAPEELAAWIDRLVKSRSWGRAYLTWVAQLPPERQAGLGNVFNGGFEWQPGAGFDWRFGRVPGVLVERVPGDGGDMELQLRFHDRRVVFNHVKQALVLAPGRYRLSVQARSEDLRNENGLVWTLTCDGRGGPLGETAGLRGDQPWHELEARFEVPAQGCGGQWLTLRLPARTAAERRIGGQASFDDVRIVRE